MNTDNNLKQQQLFGEPQFVGAEGTAGQKQVFGEPQFISGHAQQLNPLYAEPQHGVRTDPYHTSQDQQGHGTRIPIYSHSDHASGKEQLYPGQENFIGKYTTPGIDGKEHLASGGTVQTGYIPSTHKEHVHLKPSEIVQLTPDAEHIHIKAENDSEAGNIEKVIRIKPDGRIHVTAEKIEEHSSTQHGHSTEHNTEHLKERGHSTEHVKEHGHGTEHKTEHLKEHVKEGTKKRLSDKGKHHDKTTETQTVVKIQEHEHGTAGYTKEGKLGKHDDTHHDKDTHHRDTDTHHHGTETKVIVDDAHRNPEHVKVTTGKGEHDTEHLKAGKTNKKEKRASDKTKHHGTDTHHDGTDDKMKHHGTDTHHHGTDETKVRVDKDKHHSDATTVKVTEHDHDSKKHHTDTTHVKAGTISKPHDVHDNSESIGLLQQLRTTLSDSDTPNMDAIGELLLRAEVLLSKSANQPHVDPEARKTLEDISTLLITAKQMERHKSIAERLQKISDECQKALTKVKGSDAPTSAMRSASKEAVDFINIWRPVFQLLIRSRDFRQLFVDSLRIAKHVLSRNEGIVDDLSQKFIEGESTQGIKERVQEHREQNVNIKITDEEWEYLQDEILSAMVVLARNPNYHEAINKLFTLLNMFSSKMKDAKPSGAGELETHARKAKMETEELVATFTGRETLNQFKFRLRKLIRAINSDPELKRYIQDLKTFILSSKSEEEISSEAFKHRTRELIDRGRFLVNKSKDRHELDEFIDIANELIDNIKNDEYVKELRTRAGIVRSDLTYVDSEGRTKIDVDMLVKLQSVLVPVLANTFQKIHIPRIESSDSKLDFWVDNIVLCGYDIIPDNIKFHVERDTELSIKDIETKGSHTRLIIHLDKLRTEVKNVEFYFKRKTFPSLSDSGLVTLRIPENGAYLSIYFTIEDRPGESHPRLTEGYADFTISKMDIEFDKSTLKHNVLLPIGTGLMKPIIKGKIERAVETNLTNALKQLGERMTQALGEVNRPLFGNMKDTIKTSIPAQVIAQRREKLE